ncbi:type II toxin-antitoxin system VapC family toxin [Candidatus Parabeggiatoa sp. HSG14]|uniref:type II toxin-antitoxin system VapC family toxin n=1 Tax=Candidatus Parabeggiatoa sp. HSG14 TaxID=3055593 RepID=UPI0025A6B808|nr:type II toxin-antitoxin system VapC family toxin [Thiotrichales bacterium HSG14]
MKGKLLDTTALIDLFRGNEKAADFIEKAHNAKIPLFISVISAMELAAGCRNQIEVEKTKKILADFSLIHLSPGATAKAYELMLEYSKSHGLTIPDALIAATALTEGIELATDNDRHFIMISDLIVKRPY